MIEIPQNTVRRWSGPYLGNYYGSLWRTQNVDLENSPGHITLSRSFRNAADTATANMTNLQVVDNFTRTNADGTDRWWALSRAGRLAKTDTSNPTSLPSAFWAEDALGSTPTDAKDMTVHENDSDSAAGENTLLVTRDSDISVLNDTASNAWNNSWWVTTKSQTGLKTGNPHPIEYFPLARITLVGDGNWIHTIDKSKNISYQRLILPPYLQVWGIFTTPLRAWILCAGLQGKNGAIVEWDGSSATYNKIHDAQSSNALSGVNFNGVPIVVNLRGLFLEYDGNGFSPMVRNGQKICFPFYEDLSNSLVIPSVAGGTAPIAPRGMTVSDDGLIYINVQDPFLANQRQTAGIWCLNVSEGRLYAKHSLTFGGTIDYGHQIVPGVGAIKAVNPESLPATSAYLLAGGRAYETYTSAQNPAIWELDRVASTTARRGYFVTQYVPSNNITDLWDTVWLKLSAFRAASSQVIIKARGVNPLLDSTRRPIQKIFTWASATTFTATLSAADDIVQIGDEIEVMAGKNAGVLAHITAISGTQGNLQTFTIDETVASISSTSLGRFDRWKKLGIINDTSKYAVPQNIGITSSFVQFKVELRGPATDFDVKSLIINPEAQQKGKK